MKNSLIGVGLRSPHFSFLKTRPQLSIQWFETVSENHMDSQGEPMEMLEFIREDYPVALHGVGMSIGTSGGVNPQYLDQLEKLIHRVDPFIVSDHLCWTGVPGSNTHDLLPLPYTTENVQTVLENLDQIQRRLKREILLENVSSYLSFKNQEMNEWDFLSEIAQSGGCQILLDINNVYVNSKNHGFNPKTFIDGIPLDRVGQIHLAGHTDKGTYLFDTHSHPVCQDVWDLFSYTLERISPNIPILIEWDEEIPEFEVLEGEAGKARKHWDQIYAQS